MITFTWTTMRGLKSKGWVKKYSSNICEWNW